MGKHKSDERISLQHQAVNAREILRTIDRKITNAPDPKTRTNWQRLRERLAPVAEQIEADLAALGDAGGAAPATAATGPTRAPAVCPRCDSTWIWEQPVPDAPDLRECRDCHYIFDPSIPE